jgi:hypothetical protein
MFSSSPLSFLLHCFISRFLLSQLEEYRLYEPIKSVYRNYAKMKCDQYDPKLPSSITFPRQITHHLDEDGEVVWPVFVPVEDRVSETLFRKLVPRDVIRVTRPEYSACNICRDGSKKAVELRELLEEHTLKCPKCRAGGLGCAGFAQFQAEKPGLAALRREVADYEHHRTIASIQRKLFEEDRVDPTKVTCVVDFSPYQKVVSIFTFHS